MNSSNRLDTMVEMLRQLSRNDDSVGSINTFLRAMRKLSGDYALVSISRRNVPPGSYRIVRFMHQAGVTGEGLSDTLYAGRDAPTLQGGVFGEIIASEKPRLLDNAKIPDDPAVGRALAPYHTILAVPVFDEGESLNWVVYMRSKPLGFKPSEVEDLTLQANLMGGLTTAKQHARNLVAKQAELESALANLRETQDRLIAQEKLASLGALTAGIAHEIRNPLNFMTNFASLSEDGISELRSSLADSIAELPADRRQLVEELFVDLQQNAGKIREHGERANLIVKGMLGHAHQRRGESALTNVNTLVDEYSKLAFFGLTKGQMGQDVELQTEYAEGLPEIHTVPEDLGRAVLNVVTNACQAVESRRATANGTFRPVVQVRTVAENGHVQIRVRDNGVGMDAGTIQRAFEPFFTTKSTGTGTGLGLSIVHTIVVQEHYGSVEVDSQLGEYTEIRLRIPTTLGAFGAVKRA